MKMQFPPRREAGAAPTGATAEDRPARAAIAHRLFARSGVRRVKTLRALTAGQIDHLVSQMMRECPGGNWPPGFHVPLAPLTLLITQSPLDPAPPGPPEGVGMPPVWGAKSAGGYRERLRLLADTMVPGPPDLQVGDRLALAGLMDLSHLPEDALKWAAAVTIRHLRPVTILLFNTDARVAERVIVALASACPALASAWPESLDLWTEPTGDLEGWSLRGTGGPSVAVIPALPIAPEDLSDTRLWYWEVCDAVARDLHRAFDRAPRG